MLMYIHYYMFTHINGTCSLWQKYLSTKNELLQQVRDVSKSGTSENSTARLKIPLQSIRLSLKQKETKTLVLKTTHPCAMLKLSLAYHSRWSYLSVCRGAIWDVHTSLNLAIVTTKKAKEVVCTKHHPNTMYHLHAYISHILYSIYTIFRYIDISLII